MHQNYLEFQAKFKVDQFKIYESQYWIWSLRPVHNTLGAGILSLKRYCEQFSDITEAESLDIHKIVPVIEKALKINFNFEKINYLMLMMVDTHLHFHVLPRYGKEQTFNNVTFIDKGWPKLPELTAPAYETTILIQIKDLLKQSI